MTKTTGALAAMNIAMVLVCLGLPSAASAQTDLPDWARKVKFGAPIYVTTSAGESVNGTAGQITADSLVISTPRGLRTVPIREIARVQKRDPAWTGALIGGILGLAAGLQLKSDDNVCPQKSAECETERNAYAVMLPVSWALTGWGIDALIKRRSTVYEARRGARLTLELGPRTLRARIAF